MNQDNVEQSSVIRPVVKLLLVIAVLAIGWVIMSYFMGSKVEATKQERKEMVPSVEVVTINAGDYKVKIAAQGQVEATTMTTIVSEVAGAITYVSPKLKAGGHFLEGEKLVEVSRADYQVQLEQNRAAVADAELQVAQEEARAEQALRDWRRLGRSGEPSALVKREPQLKSARARLLAAKALVVKAEEDLAKTVVDAPYACFVQSSFVDKGGYLAPTGRIASIYAAGKVQVRLPLSLEDVGYLPKDLVGVRVLVSADLGKEKQTWSGHVVRTEGVIDRATHTMMTVVEVSASEDDLRFKVPPLGMFVLGTFEGKQFKGVMSVPRVAIRNGGQVWSVSSDNTLEVREVEIERSERDSVIVVNGLDYGARVVVSPIELPIHGMAVEASEQTN